MMPDKTRTILVVEDDVLVRSFIVEELADAGYDVLEADNGELAAELAVHRPFDVLFTDIRLPGAIDGWDLAKLVRGLKPRVPVIYATGYTSKRDQQLPGSVFLMKPYRPVELLHAIATLAAP
jgi:CheY-like chemotaxis protein